MHTHRFKLQPILWEAAVYHKESRLHKKSKGNVVVSLYPCRPDVGGLYNPLLCGLELMFLWLTLHADWVMINTVVKKY